MGRIKEFYHDEITKGLYGIKSSDFPNQEEEANPNPDYIFKHMITIKALGKDEKEIVELLERAIRHVKWGDKKAVKHHKKVDNGYYIVITD